MIKVTLPYTPMSKPRGQVGKAGNMTHSSFKAPTTLKGNLRLLSGEQVPYRDWQLAIKTSLRMYHPDPFPPLFCLVYVFHIAGSKLGRAQDLDNMVGGINDCLTDGWIKDDSWKVLKRFWAEALPAQKSKIELYVCVNIFDFIQFLLRHHFNFTLIKTRDFLSQLKIEMVKR